MTYAVADSTVYRLRAPGALHEVFLRGEWRPARGELAPSEQDLTHMRPISAAEAKRLTAG